MTVATTEDLGAVREFASTKPRSLWSDAWRRLKRNRMAVIGGLYILFMVFLAVAAPVVAPYDPTVTENGALPNLPAFWSPGHDARFLLGTDSLGRDELSRLIWGARVSMLVGLVPVTIITIIGVTVGLTAGWLGGRWDNFIMRLVDVVYAFPDLLFFIIVQIALRDSAIGRAMGGLVLLFGALALVGWTNMSRLVRGQVLSLKRKDFVEAAQAMGAPTHRIVLRHILPNSLAPIIVSIAFGIPSAILAEAILSFIGLGVRPPTASWGGMVYDAFAFVGSAPATVLIPAAMIALVMLAFTFLGDGLRDALDPWMSK